MSANEKTAGEASSFQTVGALLLALKDWASVPENFPYGLGALFLNIVLYQSELVPRWISVWGIIGAVLIISTTSHGIARHHVLGRQRIDEAFWRNNLDIICKVLAQPSDTAEVVAMRVRVDDSVYGVRLRQVLLGKIPGIPHRAVYQSHVIEHVAGPRAEDGDIGYFVTA